MPIESPLHARTAPLCHSLRFKDWAGYYAVCAYESTLDAEYFALRQACGLLDVTPLHKYEVRGPQAEAFLAWLWTRDVRRVKEGQVVYGVWCDEEGKVLDDGTLTRFSSERFRMTAAEPSFAWLSDRARGFDVELEDVSTRLAALALQGPTSRATLVALCGPQIAELRYFRAMRARADGLEFDITRTGYTGDLGYELWIEAERAPELWDAVMAAGAVHGVLPVGLDALDVTRVEAGFVMGGVDYVHAAQARIESQKSSPYELGLGWTVHLGRGPFIGEEALAREAREGPRWQLVGLEVRWDELEALYASYGLPPALPTAAWRTPVPIHHGAQQVGRASSGAWSPTLKKNLALATVEAAHAATGTRLGFEVTVEYERRTVPCTVVDRPFFSPSRARA